MSFQKSHLFLTAALSAFATFSLLSLYHARSRRSRRADLADHISRALASAATETRIQQPSPSPPLPIEPEPEPEPEYAEELVREQLARNYAFLHEDGVARVRAASVVIIGCGGVGSWAAVMLARSGVAKLRLVDFDYVTLSSLNRHATAALADVGTPKVQCVAHALRAIAPFVQVDPRVELWRGDADGAELLRGADWVIGMSYVFSSLGLVGNGRLRLMWLFCLQTRLIILAPRSSCLRTACRIISRCSPLWVQGPSPTRRAYRSRTSLRHTMILLLEQSVSASAPCFPNLPAQSPLHPPRTHLPPPPPLPLPVPKLKLKPKTTRPYLPRPLQRQRANTRSQWSIPPRCPAT